MYSYMPHLTAITVFCFPDIFMSFLEVLVVNVLIPVINAYNRKKNIRLEIKYVPGVLLSKDSDEENEDDNEEKEVDEEQEGDDEEQEGDNEEQEVDEQHEGYEDDFKCSNLNKSCSDSCFCVNSSDSKRKLENPCDSCDCVDKSNCQKNDVISCEKMCNINSPDYVECECHQNTKEIFVEDGLD